MKRVFLCCCAVVLIGLTAGCAPGAAVTKGVVIGPGSDPTPAPPPQIAHEDYPTAAPAKPRVAVTALKPQPTHQATKPAKTRNRRGF